MNKRNIQRKFQLLFASGILLLLSLGIQTREPSVLAHDILSAETGNIFDISALGISFIPNMGQIDAELLYQVNGTAGELFFKSHSLIFVLPVASPTNAEISDYSAVELEFLGRNEATYIEVLETLSGKVNYFSGNDPNQWLTNLPSYAGVEYQNLYEGIDLAYFGTEGKLKSNFTVAPNVNPAQIRWQYRGAERTWVDENGNLMVQLVGGATLREQAPIAWQEIDGAKQPLSLAFRVDAEGIVDFVIGDYDADYSLILDPVIEYKTYAGGSGQDDLKALTADNEGHVFVTGRTSSSNFPTTAGVIFPSVATASDVFVMKIDTNASGAASLVWSTYLDGADFGTGIAVDEDGNVYVSGLAYTSAFPTTANAYSTTSGSNTVFVTKINPTGTSLLYSSLFGRGDVTVAIDVDSNGNAYITGFTSTSGYPTTANAYQPNWVAGQNQQIFVSKIDTNASGLASLPYSTFILGNSIDISKGIAVDDAGIAYITGYTRSTNFPVTASAYQSTLTIDENTGANQDAFIVKLDTTQSGSASLLYSSYFGGNGGENSNTPTGNIAIDGLGNAYLVGETNSTVFPLVRAYQTSYGGGFLDAFVARFNTNLSGTASLVYSSFLGGEDVDQGYDIAADAFGNIHAVGLTVSNNFPVFKGLNTTIGSFVTRINTNLSGTASLLSSTRLGQDYFIPYGGIAVDQYGNTYVAGIEQIAGVPIVDGFQSSFNGVSDGFVLRMNYLADLQLIRTESNAVLPLGSSRSYTLAVINAGSDHVTGVILTEDLANIGVVDSAVSNRGTCAIVDTLVTCNIGNLLMNQSATVTINFTSSTSGTFSKTATVTGAVTDTNLSNNSHVGDTIVVNTTDLSVSQSDSPDPVVATEELTYSIAVSNNGSYDATNVVLTDTLPIGSSYLSGSASQGTGCSLTNNKVTCNLDTIAVSGTATVEIIITRSTAGTVNNLVSVKSTEIDSNTANNSSTISTTVLPPPPAAPTLLSPANSATVASLNPTFTWTWPTGASRYEIQIDPTPAMTTPAIPVTGASYIPTGALLTTTYHWRVRAFNSAGVPSEWSSISQVTILTPNNAAPITNYYTTNTPTLTWNNVTWATQYEIQVDSSSSFTAPLEFTIVVSASNLSVTTAALSEGTHYWRVRAINGTTLGAWSSTASFMIDE
jgi:uncharacterized repeat protein (TIGR01451 family)